VNIQTPKKRWGQNFLRDANIGRKIASALQTPPPRLVLEIGPGQGMLTRFLLETTQRYIGVEIDPGLARALQSQFGGRPEVQIIQQDILTLPLRHILGLEPGLHRAVIGNIPFNITSPIIFKLLDLADILNEAVLMVQNEVAERIVSAPSTKDYGLLAIHCQLCARVEKLFRVPARLFHPVPGVDSAVIRFTFLENGRNRVRDFPLFQQMLRSSFQQRRKMLRNSLTGLLSRAHLTKLTVDLSRRPEELSLSEWIALANHLARLQNEETE